MTTPNKDNQGSAPTNHANRTVANHVLAYRLTQIRKKMSALQQEQEKTSQELAQGVSQFLANAGAFDMDFDTLVGGVLEVIAEVNANPVKAEVWKKSGQTFHRNGSRKCPVASKEVANTGG